MDASSLRDSGVYDAVIVGGGPSGSSCAAFLGMKGRKALLLDKAHFPRDKTCGDGISGKSIDVLKELGIVGKLDSIPHAKIHALVFSSPDGTQVRIPVPKQEGKIEHGYTCRREVFDNMVFQNARKHADVIEGFAVTDVVWEGRKAVGVKGKDGEGREREFRAKVVVGADGATSIIAQKVGSASFDPKHRCSALRAYFRNVKGADDAIELHFVDEIVPGYFWIFPMDDGMANVGAGMLVSSMTGRVNLKAAVEKAIKHNPILKERFEGAEMVTPWKGWNLPFGSKRLKNHGEGWLLVGDAASLVDPFTGEGIGNALLSGKLAAEAIDAAVAHNDFSEKFLNRYEKHMHDEIDEELRTSHRMQRLGSVKFLLNFFMRKAARSPEIRDLMSSTMVDAKARKSYISPGLYLRLLMA